MLGAQDGWEVHRGTREATRRADRCAGSWAQGRRCSEGVAAEAWDRPASGCRSGADSVTVWKVLGGPVPLLIASEPAATLPLPTYVNMIHTHVSKQVNTWYTCMGTACMCQCMHVHVK